MTQDFWNVTMYVKLVEHQIADNIYKVLTMGMM